MDITLKDLKEYLVIDDNEDDNLLNLILKASKAYVKKYTGASEEVLSNDDISIAILILSSEMYETRTLSVDTERVNPVVSTILGMNSYNLI